MAGSKSKGKRGSKKRSSRSKTNGKRRAVRGSKIEVAQTDLMFTVPTASSPVWIDTARALSRVNRRKYEQGRLYGFQGLTFIFKAATNVATVEVKVKTAGSTWTVHNSYIKGRALWNEMQALVLDDNPSVAGKWHDFKLKLSDQQSDALTIPVLDGAGTPLTTTGAEWSQSVFVVPQHVVDPATGIPVPAEEFTAVLIGPHAATKKSLALAYQMSRATVSADQPNVPSGFSDSFFNILTDQGSQEPELAERIEGEDDNPPYDINEYPGAGTNAPTPFVQGYAAVSTAEVDGHVGPFTAECGLIELEVNAFTTAGAPVAKPDIDVILHVMPGAYQGVASVPMGQ